VSRIITNPFDIEDKDNMSTNSPGVVGATSLNPSPEKFESDPSHYKICSILGQCCGSIGIVLLAVHGPSASLVALKKFNMDKAKDEIENIQVQKAFHLLL